MIQSEERINSVEPEKYFFFSWNEPLLIKVSLKPTIQKRSGNGKLQVVGKNAFFFGTSSQRERYPTSLMWELTLRDFVNLWKIIFDSSTFPVVILPNDSKWEPFILLTKVSKFSFQALAQVLFNLIKLGYGAKSVEQGRFYLKSLTEVCIDQEKIKII